MGGPAPMHVSRSRGIGYSSNVSADRHKTKRYVPLAFCRTVPRCSFGCAWICTRFCGFPRGEHLCLFERCNPWRYLHALPRYQYSCSAHCPLVSGWPSMSHLKRIVSGSPSCQRIGTYIGTYIGILLRYLCTKVPAG